jgi:hypothetical protein
MKKVTGRAERQAKGATQNWLPLSASKCLPGQDSVTTVETYCFSLRHLPFGFLTQHIGGAFPPYSVGGLLASSPASGKISKQKRPMLKSTDLLFAGSPGRTRTCNLVVNSHPLCRLSYRGI